MEGSRTIIWADVGDRPAILWFGVGRLKSSARIFFTFDSS